MKNILSLLTIFLASIAVQAQNCNANFGYTMGPNNVVTILDSSTSSCPLIIQYNYGDTASGFFNTNGTNSHFYKNAGTYTICQYVSTYTPTCSNICSDTLCQQIILPNNGTNCQAAYSVNVNDWVCSFTNLSTSDDPAVNFLWDFGDGSVSTISNPNHTYTFTATYHICLYVEASDGCQSVVCSEILVDGASVYYYSTVGIKENSKNNSFAIYPNPNNGFMQAEILLKKFEEGLISIYSVEGKLIETYELKAGENKFKIQQEQLPAGVYFYKLYMNKQDIVTKRIIIVK